MSERAAFVVVAHHDDWQLFMGSDIFKHLRDPQCRVVVIVTTAGDAGDDDYHWKARHSGNLLSLLRALPSFTPYDGGTLPTGFSVEYTHVDAAEKPVLKTEIRDGAQRVTLYSMHLPDGGDGLGFAPRFESLQALHGGKSARTLWPPDKPAVYTTWDQFEAVVRAIIERERNDAQGVFVHAASLDTEVNAGDHSDHRYTSMAVDAIVKRDPTLHPVWYVTYALASREENLDGREAHDQRAAIHAYGGGYTAAASGSSETWRTGWLREYPAFRNRRYSHGNEDYQERSNEI